MLCSQSSAGAVVTGQFVCLQCRERPPRFDCAVSARQHEGLARDLIARFKYHGEHYLCRPLAAWMATALREDARLRDWATEGEGAALVPVPLHARRRRERGFNQAESLCAALARESGLQVWHALRRVRYTRTQTELTRQQRQQNLYAAITVDARFEERIAGARVLLVDDVFTTGATVNECARTLWQSGAAGVRVLTVVRRL
jgi:ComF family protein